MGGSALTHLRCEFLLLLTWPRPEQPGVGHFKTFSYMARTSTGKEEVRETAKALGADGRVTGRSATTVVKACTDHSCTNKKKSKIKNKTQWSNKEKAQK